MTVLLAVIVMAAAMAASYMAIAAFPRLRRWVDDIPVADEVAARLFERTIPGADRRFDETGLNARSRQDGTFRR